MFYTIQNGQLLTAGNIGALAQYYDNVQELPSDYNEIKYKVINGELVLNPNWEEEVEEQKRKHIASLTCTKRVFALMLQKLGVDYITQLKPLIESNPQAQLEWDLCIELLRENPMLDLMAGQLGITSEQLDALFLYANGELSEDDFMLYANEGLDENTTNE